MKLIRNIILKATDSLSVPAVRLSTVGRRTFTCTSDRKGPFLSLVHVYGTIYLPTYILTVSPLCGP